MAPAMVACGRSCPAHTDERGLPSLAGHRSSQLFLVVVSSHIYCNYDCIEYCVFSIVCRIYELSIGIHSLVSTNVKLR